MSKILSVMRHAKSSWENQSLNDSERPLILKGIRRTQRVARHMSIAGMLPDVIWCSPAVRATQTADVLNKSIEHPVKLHINNKLYEHSAETIINEIKRCARQINHLMIVGHNPTFSILVNQLAGYEVTGWLPTSGVVSICFSTDDWTQILKTKSEVKQVIIPKELKNKEK